MVRGGARRSAFASGWLTAAGMLKLEAVHMPEAATLTLGFLALLTVIGLAGLLYDRIHKTDPPHSWRNGAVQRHAVIMSRYYHDVGDSHSG